MRGIPGPRGGIPLQLALFTGAAVAILAGATFNQQGHSGATAAVALLSGTCALAAGIVHRNWRYALALAGAAVVLTLADDYFLKFKPLELNLAGCASLALAGVIGSVAYLSLTKQMRQRVTDLEKLNAKLQEQHRIFLAATEDPGLQDADIAVLTANTARQTEAGFCCYYLLGPDGQQYVPQLPGVGFDLSRPQAVAARTEGDALIAALEAGQDLYGADAASLAPLQGLLPKGFKVDNALVVPMRVGPELGGFVLLGNRPRGFNSDDRRLATTVAMRAGIHLASAHAVASSRGEAAHYALLNEIAKQASGMPFEQVMQVVLEKAKKLIRFDSARVAVFSADGTYVLLDGNGVPSRIEASPLKDVYLQGHTVIRRMVGRSDGLFSGLHPSADGAQVAEALTPIRGKEEVFGALCLGRQGGLAFSDKDVPELEELGAIAGVAVENSRMLQAATGQANKLDNALGALVEISQALTATTQGPALLERKTLEAAARLNNCQFALMTKASGPDSQRVTWGVGFPPDLAGFEFKNGQGVIGAVMLSKQPLAVADTVDTFDLAAPPDLAGFGLHGALCVPMLQDDELWGTLSVFTGERRDWSDGDVHLLATLASEALVAMKNAELYESSQRMVWELGNLHNGLKAVTETLDLGQVLELVLGWAAKASEAQIGCLALEENGELNLVGSYGTDHETAGRLALELGGEVCLEVMKSGEPFLEYEDKKDGRTEGPLDPTAVLCVPLMLRDEAIGVLFLANYQKGHAFKEDHRRLVASLAAQAAVAIDNARLFKDREEVTLAALNALAAAVDARDPYTAGHSHRVTDYALAIAGELKYAPGDDAAWRRLRQGCLLHDIGKIGVPDAVLSKPGRLTPEEFEAMKAHPVVGYDVLKGLKMLTDELVIVRSHHERFDGKGYPDAKKKDELPIYAYIVAAADALDAMTSDRPYRKAMSLEVALAEIQGGAGTHFHPAVAAAVQAAARKGTLKVIKSETVFANAPAVGAFENPTS
jgi:GAF domain-containing protein